MGYEEFVIHIEPNGTARLAPLPSTAESVATALREIARRGGNASWLEDAVAVLDVPFTRRRPSRVLELALEAPREARPLLLAEYWHLLLTGTHHDPAYNLAVALDARGDAFSNPPRLLAESLAAAARRVPPKSRWRIERDSETSVAASALRALSHVPRALDFMAGWALVLLKGVWIDADLVDEARSLASGLSDRFSARAHCVRWLAGDAVRPTVAPFPATREPSVRRWGVPCDYGSFRGMARVLIGRPASCLHPLRFQAAWIREQQGGRIPPEVMERVRELSSTPQLTR